jgi:hypothetical protein
MIDEVTTTTTDRLVTSATGRTYRIDRQGRAHLVDATRHECECGGSGKFYSGGMILNGVYTGTIGVCYRCGGKGYQTEADVKRNRYYDSHVRRIYA